MGFYKKTADNRAADSAPASAPASEDPSSGNLSFLSRFSLPLRSRTRYIADFHIRPAEPHRKYGAGDQVQGAVILTVVKPVRITHLVVSLHGYMRVFKNPAIAASEPVIDPTDVPAFSNRSSRQKTHGNGFVRLFQDEQTLSGDGRLEPGRYEFNFNLLFPTDRLPSSIDFERGTISYMITATLTRPASIGTKSTPKTSCERKIYLVEKVDVGSLTPPRPRTIYLEPISKRPKKKKQPIASVEKGPVGVDTAISTSDQDSTRANENSTEGSLSVIGEDLEQDPAGNNPRSPLQSDVRSISSDSAVSGSTGRSKPSDGHHMLATTPSLGGKNVPGVKERTITATVELLKGGCLQGDVLPIKISVQHIRRIKSLHGVIVTLYRLGRIDSAPPLLTKDLPEAEIRRLEKEEYYPKSKTGLGGLSLSSAGSCSVFRKDLSQAFAPLIIDPDTLTANLTTSVRVPEDVFPTIKGVPYEMISFRYHIEVIVDLGGKLAYQIQSGKPSGTRMSPVAGPLGVTGSPYDASASSLTSWGTSIIDTDRLRRQKGVICVVFEVVVGTTDSSRLRGKRPMKPEPAGYTVPLHEAEVYDGGRSEKQPWPTSPHGENGYAPDEYPQDYAPSPHTHAPPLRPPQPYRYWNGASPQQSSAPHYIPPPEIPDESTLTEKERIRRAEQRLLPSEPPPEPLIAGPSNSYYHNGENIYDADDQPPPPPVPGPSRNPEPPPPQSHHPQEQAPTAPTLEDLSQPSPIEDKQELERRRLLAEASAPPEFPEDYDHAAGPSNSPQGAVPLLPPPRAGPSAAPMTEVEFEPSAPVLLEDEEVYGPHYTYGTAVPGALPSSSSAQVGTLGGVAAESLEPSEPLPRYER
ncbi:hypothetical protein C8A03DRAFT_35177 [Achaetomium macrosporum]|uniref:Arrestin C-terminal-like domain-containing protein n=1 Tax=Achaetomium macrosporum TaxID=79813 RepID=A0AAN7C7Z7_9PEZI|nr:hypothetical protein C8A03DRAFT_35177 [Achaetomium macrosporum]